MQVAPTPIGAAAFRRLTVTAWKACVQYFSCIGTYFFHVSRRAGWFAEVVWCVERLHDQRRKGLFGYSNAAVIVIVQRHVSEVRCRKVAAVRYATTALAAVCAFIWH